MARTITSVAAGSNRNRAVLMLAVVFGLFSAMLVFAFLNSRDSGNSVLEKAVTGEANETVLVASEDIKVGDSIDSKVKPQSVSILSLLPGGFKSNSEVAGKVALTPIYKGEQIIEARTSTSGGQKTLAFKIPTNNEYRAVSIQVPHEAWIAGGLPQPGDRVDILAITTLKRTDPLTGQERPDVVAGIIAEDVEILAVSQTVVKSATKTDGKKSAADPSATALATGTPGSTTVNDTRQLDSGDTFQKAISITLSLPVDKAAKLALIDALNDDVAQYRLLPRRSGNSDPISGTTIWSFDDIFPKKK